MKYQNSEEMNEGNVPALLGSKAFCLFCFYSIYRNALKPSVLMNEPTYFNFDIDTKLYSFAFKINGKGKKQKVKYVERGSKINNLQ